MYRYSLGLDIGTTSVGWAVANLEKQRIEDMGVRIFERPEDPKTGKSLAEPRRTARSARRRLKRRRQRLNALKAFFIENKLLTSDQIENLIIPSKEKPNPYLVREKGLSERLSNEELFVALRHIAKRRGYKSNRKSVEERDAEGSRVLSAISDNAKILTSHNTNSVAVALNKDVKFQEHKRNKADDYRNSFVRQNFLNESRELIEKQREFGLSLTDKSVENLLFEQNKGIFYQRPFMTPELIEKMRGKCTFEKNEPRIQKASITFEMFRLATDLMNLTLVIGGERIALDKDEIAKCIEKAKSTRGVTYKAIRETLGYKNDDKMRFDYIRGKRDKDGKPDESNAFCELKFYHGVKSALKELPEEWVKIEKDEDIFDQIGYVITANKDDDDIKNGLAKLNLSSEAIDQLLKLSFSGFGHLSSKALRKITPHILDGKTYDEAVVLAGYTFAGKLSGDKTKLPPLSEDDSSQITNPVVKRAISQTIKVINAVIRKYGAPEQIKIECANELAKNFDERRKIKKAQDENADRNNKIVERLKSDWNIANPSGLQITKFKLYSEQGGKCLYSGKSIDLNQLFSDERYCEIDHIIPFSRCGNDSNNNKALVLNSENQNKRNLTPYEVWGNDEKRWTEFKSRVLGTAGISYTKQQRLLSEEKPKEDWNARALNDTRYITRFMSDYLRKNLKFAESSKGNKKVVTPAGTITSYLRRRWGMGRKDRNANNLHHAVDACIIAVVDDGIIQEFAKYNKYGELGAKYFKYQSNLAEITDPETGEIINKRKFEDLEQHLLPWPRFNDEVFFRTSVNTNMSDFGDQFRAFPNYDEEFKNNIHPVFVSRMPKRGGTGPTNQETIRSPKVIPDESGSTDKQLRAQKMNIKSVTPEMLENSLTKRTDPKLYEILKARLEWGKAQSGTELIDENGKKRKFGKIDQKGKPDALWLANTWKESVYKKDKNGNDCNLVCSIKVLSSQPSGREINNGKAFVNNGSMIKLDVYRRVNKKHKIEHFFVPVYSHQIGVGSNKILPAAKIDGKIVTNIDESFSKVCSLYPNDYVRCEFADDSGKVLKTVEGYYVKYAISGGNMTFIDHLSSSKDGGNLIACSARSATSITRYDISILGDNAPRD